MATYQPLQDLKQYVRDCRLLKRDFEQALAYLDFQADGGETGLAVDFSEIHEYLLPGANGNHLGIFGWPDETSATLFDRAILRQLFEQSDPNLLTADGKLILMDPYAIEFDGFLHWLEASQFTRYADKAISLFNEARQALALPEFDQLSDLSTEVQATGRELNSEERANLLLFLERNAPSLFAFMGEFYQDPLLSAKRLLVSDKFRSLKDFSGGNEPEIRVFNRWYSILLSERGERREYKQIQSGNDAMAVALLSQANLTLPSNKRLYLVTRSAVMHNVFEREYKNSLWSDYLLLHPRVFSILSSLALKTPKAAREDLSSRLRAIELFLSTINVDTINRNSVRNEPEYVRSLTENIQLDWKARESLAISSPALSAIASGKDLPTVPVLVQMINVLQDPKALVQLVVERLDDLATGIESEHDVLSLYYRSQGTREQHVLQRLRAQIAIEYRGDYTAIPRTVWVLGTSTHAMPYTLHFYTDEAGNVLDALTREHSWRQVFTALGQSWTTETEYELPLIVGYVSAVLNRWKLAKEYAQRALDIAGRVRTVAMHEALFFFAITLRKSDDEAPRAKHVATLNYLRRAIDAKQQWLGDNTYSDPRYLKELGTQILRLNVYYGTSDEYPAAEEGLSRLTEALAVCEDDQLRLQILNSRVFYQLEAGINPNMQALKGEWNELVDLQMAVEPEESEWSPAILDTIAWGEWLVNNKHLTSDRYQTVLRRLELASKCIDCSLEDRRLIRQHLLQFQKGQ